MSDACKKCCCRKKRILYLSICVCILLVLSIVGAAIRLVSFSRDYNLGCVTDISADKIDDGLVELRIKYLIPSGGYFVRNVSPDEGRYIGDGMVDYNGEIGKHRILIRFGDLALHEFFTSKTDENGIIQLSCGLRASVSYPEDHGFVLYIGSDEPISVVPINNGELNALGGTIKIPITIGEAQ